MHLHAHRLTFINTLYAYQHRQSRRMLGLELSISSPQGFYKKIATSEIELNEDFLN